MRTIGSIFGAILFIALISFIISSASMSEEEMDEINKMECEQRGEDRVYVYNSDTNECIKNELLSSIISGEFQKQMKQVQEIMNSGMQERVDCWDKEGYTYNTEKSECVISVPLKMAACFKKGFDYYDEESDECKTSALSKEAQDILNEAEDHRIEMKKRSDCSAIDNEDYIYFYDSETDSCKEFKRHISPIMQKIIPNLEVIKQNIEHYKSLMATPTPTTQ